MRVISDCVADAEKERGLSPDVVKRMKNMQEFLNTIDTWYAQMLNVPHSKLEKLMKMGSKVVALLTLRSPR